VPACAHRGVAVQQVPEVGAAAEGAGLDAAGGHRLRRHPADPGHRSAPGFSCILYPYGSPAGAMAAFTGATIASGLSTAPGPSRLQPELWRLAYAGANRALGLSDKLFALGDSVIITALHRIALMPVFVLSARICPEVRSAQEPLCCTRYVDLLAQQNAVVRNVLQQNSTHLHDTGTRDTSDTGGTGCRAWRPPCSRRS
jgi:hypothetical protein